MNDRTRMLQRYLDGELDASGEAQVRRMLTDHADWREELVALQQLWQAVDAAGAPKPDPPIWPAVADVLAARRRPATWTVAQRLLAAAAMVSGVLLGYGATERSDPSLDALAGGEDVETLADTITTLDALWLEMGGGDEEAGS